MKGRKAKPELFQIKTINYIKVCKADGKRESYDFHKALYDDILSLYVEMEQIGRTEVNRVAENPQEPEFRVAVTPFERGGAAISVILPVFTLG